MKLGIMQPYFLPYLGYFSLIKNTDEWIVFDNVQYINRGWINRNRILSESKDGISYITIPVIKQSREMLIKDAMIDDSQNWRGKIYGQVNFYKKKAPYYSNSMQLIKKILDFKTRKISELNTFALKALCDYLELDFKYSVFSENTKGIVPVCESDEWALKISIANGANTYINPPGGKSFFDKNKYEKAGIELKFLNQKLNPYETLNQSFIPGLSILDVMMFNSPQSITKMLDDYELE